MVVELFMVWPTSETRPSRKGYGAGPACVDVGSAKEMTSLVPAQQKRSARCSVS